MNNKFLTDATIEEAPESIWAPVVTFLSGPNNGQKIAVTGQVFSIGRSNDNSLSIDNKAVSRNHSEILTKDGRYTIRDLNSKWGTLLNGQKITEAEMKFGDEIEIGEIRMNFSLAPRESICPPKPNWLRIILMGMIVLAIGSSVMLHYFRNQIKENMSQPAGDVLSQIIHHYDLGISYYNQIGIGDDRDLRDRAINEMKTVIELDPGGLTRFSTSARRIIDGLEK